MVSTVIPLALPMLPNFLRMAPPNQDFTVDVATLNDDTLRELGREWTEALVAHAAARRKNGAR